MLLLLSELEQALADHDEQSRASAKEENTSIEQSDISTELEAQDSSKSKGKGKAAAAHHQPESVEVEVKTISAKGEERRRIRLTLILKLRELEVLHHRVEFVLGDTYHRSGSSKEEDESYARAETLRRKLLKGRPLVD